MKNNQNMSSPPPSNSRFSFKNQVFNYIFYPTLLIGFILIFAFQNCKMSPNSSINEDSTIDLADKVRSVASQDGGLFTSFHSENPKTTKSLRNNVAPSLHNNTNDDLIVRSRQVQIKFEQLDIVKKAISQLGSASLPFNLFDNTRFMVSIERIESTSTGYILFGRLANPLEQLTLVVNGHIVTGTLRTLKSTYRISTASDQKSYTIQEVDLSVLPPEAEPLMPPDSQTSPIQSSPSSVEEDGSRIDVAVFYTSLARQAKGGHAQIEALIDLWAAETNQAYKDSDVDQRIFLVTKEEVEYNENDSPQNPLERLRYPLELLLDPDDGYMDEVHIRRNELKADIVHLVLTRGAYGYAYYGPNEQRAFSYTSVYSDGTYLAHELGHNMGLFHDRYVDPRPIPSYSHGYVNQKIFDAQFSPPNEDAKWRTIMAYYDQCRKEGSFYCRTIMRFSNANQTYNGDPLGTLDESNIHVGPAHAQRTLNETRKIVANFRTRSPGADVVIQSKKIQIEYQKKGNVKETVEVNPPTPIALQQRQPFSLSTNVYNIGLNDASTESILYLYQQDGIASSMNNANSQLSTIETRVVKALDVGEASLKNIELRASSTPGTYSYKFCVNNKNNHNCSRWLSIQVTSEGITSTTSTSTSISTSTSSPSFTPPPSKVTVTGLSSFSNPKASHTWRWQCHSRRIIDGDRKIPGDMRNNPGYGVTSCRSYRHKLISDANFSFTNESYNSTNSTSYKATSSKSQTMYLYVQAKDDENNVSKVVKVSGVFAQKSQQPRGSPTPIPPYIPTPSPSIFPSPTPSEVINGVCNQKDKYACLSPVPSTNKKYINKGKSGHHYEWDCPGSNGGKMANCNLHIPFLTPKAINGQCGAIRYQCKTGTPANFQEIASGLTFKSIWRCLGLNGGLSASCSIEIVQVEEEDTEDAP